MEYFSVWSITNNSMSVQDLPFLGSIWNETSKAGNFLTVQILASFVCVLGAFSFADGKYFSIFRSKNVLYKIPGPTGLPLIGNLHQILMERDIVKRLGEFTRQFQPYCRIQVGPKSVILLTTPESIEKLLSSNENGHIIKADEYAALEDYWDDGLGTSCGDKWRARRKVFSPLFNYKCFPHFLEVFNRQSKILIKDLDKMFSNNLPKPIQNQIYESALKVICETAMGVELNDTTAEFDKFFYDAEKCKEYIWLKVTRPWYRMKWIWKFLPFRQVYEQNVKDIKDYMYKVIREARKTFEKRQGNEDPSDLKRNKTVMDVMLENGMSDSEIREEAHTIVSAGHETSAAVLQFALMFMALYPEHQAECQKEVDDIINNDSLCPDGNFTLTSLGELRYIEKCIKETLRIYPIAYMFGRKLQAPLKMEEGLVFPAGTTCVICPADLHRNSDIYPEPDKFDPSRFTPENCSTRHPYAYIPFSAGPRICLGYKFAMAEMKLVLARILHHFTIQTTDKLEDIPLDLSIVLTPVRGYNFVLEKRNPVPT